MPGADALRVQVRLSGLAHPELYGALRDLPPRRRADRLRQLALLGLQGVGLQGLGLHGLGLQGLTGGSVPAVTPEDPASEAHQASDPRRKQLLAGLNLVD